jgi:hypothetical protein
LQVRLPDARVEARDSRVSTIGLTGARPGLPALPNRQSWANPSEAAAASH